MPQTRSRGTRASVVKPEVMGQVASFLDELPDKPKDQLSLKEAISELLEPIQAAFNKGYTYPEIADILRDHGIQISAFTLKSYVPRGRKQSSAKKATAPRKTRKPAEAASVIQEPAEASTKATSAKAISTTSQRSTAKVAKPKAATSTSTRKTAAKAAPTAKTTTTGKATGTTTRKRRVT